MRNFSINARKLIVRVIILGGLFSQGLICGHLAIHGFQPEPLAETAEIQNENTSGIKPDPTYSIPKVSQKVLAQKRELGQSSLLNGEPYEALRELLVVYEHQPNSNDFLLLFQIALCYEAANDLSSAQDLYRRISNQDAVNVEMNLVEAAQIALARTMWKTGDRQLAMEILWKKVFSISSEFDKHFHGDLLHLVAQLVSEEATLNQSMSLLDRHSLRGFPIDFRPDRELKQLLALYEESTNKSNSETQEVDSSKILTVNDVWQVEDSVVMDLECRNSSILNFLQLLQESTQLDFQITDQATTAVYSHHVDLLAPGISLELLLDRVTIPYGLWWQRQDNTIIVGANSESSPDYVADLLLKSSERLLSQAILEYPEHDFLAHSQFNSALVQVHRNDLQEAVLTLLDLLESTGNARLRQCCYFNLSKTYSLMEQNDLSLDAMQRVSESASIGDVLTAAFIEIGAIQLGRGEIDNAIHSFSRAIRVSSNKKLIQIGAINLASAYILNGNPSQAKQILVETNKYFDDGAAGILAKYLAGLAWFEIQNKSNSNIPGVDQSIEATASTSNLLAMLPKVLPIDHVGAHQHLLIAKGWSAIGATKEVERVVNDGIDAANGKFIYENLLRLLAFNMIKENNIDATRQILASLEYDSNNRDSLKALLAWSRLEMNHGEYEKCESLCRALLQLELDEEILKETFQLLGLVHRSRGQHRLAALYFAGFMPE